MNEEMNTNSQVVEDNTNDYINTINDLRANTVSRQDYDRIVRENRQLLNSITNGTTPEVAKPKEKKDLNKLREDIVSYDGTNLGYIERVLEYRNEMIEQGYDDPFIPKGHKVSANAMDVEAANRVAECFQHCVDYANGDNQLFTAELQRITRDTAPRPVRRR